MGVREDARCIRVGEGVFFAPNGPYLLCEIGGRETMGGGVRWG